MNPSLLVSLSMIVGDIDQCLQRSLSLYLGREMAELRQELLKLEGKHRSLLGDKNNNLRALSSLKRTEKYLSGQRKHTSTAPHIQPIASNNSLSDEPRKRHSTHHHETPTKTQSVIYEKLQEKQKERNKRMIGFMSQYLQKAKTNLETEEEKTKKKEEVERQVQEEEERRIKVLREEKKAATDKEKQRLTDKKEQLSRDILALENNILVCRYKSYVRSIEGMVTKTVPPLFWKPNKELEQTKPEQERTAAWLEDKLKEATKEINSVNEPEAYGKSIANDKLEYYHSVITNHLKSQQSYILTETQPHIFWKPLKIDQHIEQLQKDTSTRLGDEIKRLMPVLEDKHPESEEEGSESELHLDKQQR